MKAPNSIEQKMSGFWGRIISILVVTALLLGFVAWGAAFVLGGLPFLFLIITLAIFFVRREFSSDPTRQVESTEEDGVIKDEALRIEEIT